MGTYLAILRGAISLLNRISAALQQHHDEINGENKIIATDNAEKAKADEAALQSLTDDSAKPVRDSLRGGGF